MRLLGLVTLIYVPGAAFVTSTRQATFRRVQLHVGGWTAESLCTRLSSLLEFEKDKSVVPAALVSSNIVYSGDIEIMSQTTGVASYTAMCSRWAFDAAELLPDYHTCVERVAPMNTGSFGAELEVCFNWYAAFSPVSGIGGLATVASAMGWKVERVEPSDDRVVTFSAQRLADLLWTAIRTKVLKLPGLVIRGRAMLRFDRLSGLCTSHRETIFLVVDSADTGRLRNRLVAENLAAYLDVCRRPEGADSDAWAQAVSKRILRGVPGTEFLAIVPNENEAEGALVIAVVAVACAISLACTSILM